MTELITIIIKIVLFVLGIWVVTLISVLLHEFGHALGYMLATGDRNWHIQIGQGKQLLNTKALTINMIVIDGYFAPAENMMDLSKAQFVMMLSGGPIVSLLLVVGLIVLNFGGISFFSEAAASGLVRVLLYAGLFINSLILFWSVIPAYGIFRNMEDVGTDVMQIIDALKGNLE